VWESGTVLRVQSDRVIAESVHKIGSPVILITRRVKRIKRALERREWHRLHAKQGWRTEFTVGCCPQDLHRKEDVEAVISLER
jgi:hypothetical protein